MHFSRSGFLRLTLRYVLLAFVVSCTSATSVRAGNPPVIISSATALSVVNDSFNYQIILADFASGTYTADNLVPGLTLDARVGAISGAPSQTGTFVITLHAANSNGTTSSPLTLTVVPAFPPKITSPLTATGVRGTDYRYQITATNDPADFTAEGLPAGLSFDSLTGAITGVPTEAGNFQVGISAGNFQGRTLATLSINVVLVLPVVTLTADTPTANPLVGDRGRFTLTRSGEDLTQPVTVVFTIKGSAQNGVDYQLLPFSKTIKAGKSVKRIHVSALIAEGSTPAPDSKKAVKLTLQPSDAYVLGDATTAKVKIFYVPPPITEGE